MENQQPLPALRPLRLGELLDQAIRLYRRNFLTFIGIIALVYVPLTVLQTAAAALMSASIAATDPRNQFANMGYLLGVTSTTFLVFVQVILVQGFATGAMTRAMADDYLGRQIGILQAYRGIGKSWGSLLGALFLIAVFYIIASFWWIFIPCVGWFTGLGMMVFLLGVINPLTPSVVVLEEQNAFDSIRRAWSLARRRFWHVLGYIFVLYVFSWIVVSGPSMIANLALTGLAISFDDPILGQVLAVIIQSLVSLTVSLIYHPLQMTAFTLIYLDLRVRTEGLDIALATMPAAAEMTVNQIMAPPAALTEPFMTWHDLGNFAILTLSVLGVFILFYSMIIGAAMLAFSSFR
jgi:hypothetical protein